MNMELSTEYLTSLLVSEGQGNFVMNQSDFYAIQRSLLGKLKPFLANVLEEIFLSVLELDESRSAIHLNLKPNGWSVKLSEGSIKTLLITPMLSGIFLTLDYNQVPSLILPTIIPFLFEIERCRLSKKEDVVIGELYLNAKLKNKKLNAEQVYALLSQKTRKQLPFLDFIDFLDKFHLAGFLNKQGDDSYEFNPKGNPKFRIIFK